MAPVLQHLGLALNLVVDGVLKVLEGVDVLHLRAGAQLLGAHGAQGHIDVGAEVAFLHAAVGHIDVLHDGLDLFHVGAGFLGGAHVRLGDDFQQGHAGAVVVHIGRSRVLDVGAGMHQLACVLLHVDAGQADALLLPLHINIHPAMLGNGQVVLGGLPVLGQVGVVVVLAVKLAVLVDFAVGGKPRLDAELHHPLVHRGQHAGHAKAHRTHMGVLVCAKTGGAAAENLGLGLQFAMYFQADYGFILHQLLPPSFAIFV